MNTNRRTANFTKLICTGLCLSTVLLAGCRLVDNRIPNWVANPKSVYPESQYLVAVGEGDTRRTAENAAAANLARIFEAHIKSNERLLDQSHETTRDLERTTDFTVDINIHSSQTLFNIQHAEAWQDKKGRVHAIAYLDRRKTAAIYRDKIDEQTIRIRFLLAQAGQADDILIKYAALRTAVRHVAENRILLRQLKVIHSPSVPDATPGYTENNIRRSLAETAKQIRVRIKVDGDEAHRMKTTIEELVTRYGFVAGIPAVLEISGNVAVTDTGQRVDDLVFVRYALALQIKDADGTVLASINEKGRESHISLAGAHIRSFRTLENIILPGGSRRLDAYFDSLIDQTPQ